MGAVQCRYRSSGYGGSRTSEMPQHHNIGQRCRTIAQCLHRQAGGGGHRDFDGRARAFHGHLRNGQPFPHRTSRVKVALWCLHLLVALTRVGRCGLLRGRSQSSLEFCDPARHIYGFVYFGCGIKIATDDLPRAGGCYDHFHSIEEPAFT